MQGETNPNWKADTTASWTLHDRARRAIPEMGECEHGSCDEPAADRHHIDGNPANNARENLACLCRRHHMQIDGRMDAMLKRNAQGVRKIDEATDERIAELWREGRTAAEIATELGKDDADFVHRRLAFMRVRGVDIPRRRLVK